MNFDDLFEQRDLVGRKLKDIIVDKGCTKVSFAKKTDISRPTLDKLLDGRIDSKSTFDRHLRKIMEVLNMTASDLLLYTVRENKRAAVVYSQNAPKNHEMSDTAKKQYDLLLDIIDVCAIYY